MTRTMTENKLYQVFDKEFNDEKFCFNADNQLDAVIKLTKWTDYHSFNGRDYELREVKSPKYKDNVHNEWVK